jgi:adenylate kinase family enzyme
MTPQRIAVVGPVASGKSTLAAAIAAHTGLPHVDLDQLFWSPGWTPVHADTFASCVASVARSPRWVIDGNYGDQIGETVLGHAQLAVWLDLPLRVCLPRLLRRSLRRARSGQELFAGNRETWSHLIARDSILRWGPAHHHRHRRRWQQTLAHPTTGLTVVRIARSADLTLCLRGLGLLPAEAAACGPR